jgi:carbamoyl-phosphate synthase large subunit
MVSGRSDADIHRVSKIDPWFLAKLRRIVDAESCLMRGRQLDELDAPTLL